MMKTFKNIKTTKTTTPIQPKIKTTTVNRTGVATVEEDKNNPGDVVEILESIII